MSEITEETVRKPKRQISWQQVALFLSFFAPFVSMLAIFIGNGIYPFGSRSFLFSDMYHQYMPFFQEFVNKIREGQSITYTWNVGVGSNFLALYIYYLASPLNWLAFLVPNAYLMEFMSYLVVVKVGLSGLCAYLYFKYRTKDKNDDWSSFAALVTSVFYAMSGFVAAYNWDIMWMDCVVLLPLILLGLEKLVHEKRMTMYCITLGLCIFTNFYISIMVCIFLVLYFIMLFFTEKKSIGMVLRFAAGSLLAGALAAILLIPEVYALLATDFGDFDFPKKWEAYFSILDVLARHCMGVTTERALEHWPNIYCGAIVFLLAPLYAVNEAIPLRRRFGFFTLAGVFLLSFATNGLDFIWHGMNYPDSLPARQSFIYILLVLVMCYESLVHIREIAPPAIIKCFLGAVVCFLLIEKFVDIDDFMTWTWLLNLAIVTVYAVCLYLCRTRTGVRTVVVAGTVFLVVVLGESAANMAMTSVGTTNREAYFAHLEDYSDLYQRAVGQEEGFTRFEKFTRKTKNDSLLSNYPSASVFSSTLNSYVMDYYKKFGMRHSKVYYGYDGATGFASALLNVGYLFGEKAEYENALYEKVDEQNKLYLFRANYSLPFGYVAPPSYDVPTKTGMSSVSLQNEMVNALGLEGVLLKRCDSMDEGDDVSFTSKADGIYYGYVANSGTKKVKVTGGELVEQSHKDLKKGDLLYIGQLAKGESVTMTNDDDSDDSKNISVYVYKLDLELLGKAIDLLKEQHLENVTVGQTKITGDLSLKEAGRLILTVPYEKGWSVWVNEQSMQPETFGGAFLALDLEPGEYAIRLEYEPSGKKAGILVSVLGLICGAAGLLIARRKSKA